jgi:predicted helicase
MSAIKEYINKLSQRYKTGISTEHSYRGDLQNLLEALVTRVLVTNEPSRISCGAPDYIITRQNIPVGYIEAKDIGADLLGKNYKEQFERYRNALNNLIVTDYLTFQFFVDGQPVTSIQLGQIIGGKIIPLPDNYPAFTNLITDFCNYSGQSIRSASKLSKMMAAKARLLANVIENALAPDTTDHVSEYTNSLNAQYVSFQQVLIHDITEKAFADIYAQTIAYGMFAARLHDTSLDTFSRQEAAELIPRSNPFLRKLFQYIAGYDLDDRIKWMVDALADIFRATNVAELLADFGKATRQTDPMIHFYETFLSEYDPKLRKSRGVWYTPEPVVNFIVRAVDDILKTEFDLPLGLADTSKVKIKVKDVAKSTADQRSKTKTIEREEEVHRVQILDPATGTGTFLAEVVKQIHKQFEGQQGIWNNYVEDHLIPRINGFEILMASYAMAHLKLDMLLTETGYKPRKDQRLRIYLTNSLEEHHPDTGTLFANWLSTEANEANHIKRDTPVMVVIGNPPYSGESANKGEWIMKLMEDYKKEPGGKAKLKERNPKWINDDYVKFIRFGQHFIEKNGSGILAFINPHGYLDNPTFRGMRWNLLKTFDKIYTIDLHGNSKKKETTPDGSPDENVFDIMQGVSINLFVKNGKKNENDLGKVNHYDIFGNRDFKYDFLNTNSIKSVSFTELKVSIPNFNFIVEDLQAKSDYCKGLLISDLFFKYSLGVTTARDSFSICFTENEISRKVVEFLELSSEEARIKYNLGKDARDWSIDEAKNDLIKSGIDSSRITRIDYRPFDTRHTYYTGKSKGFHCMPRSEVMNHMFSNYNIAINLVKVGRDVDSDNYFLSKNITDKSLVSSLDNSSVFPLYLYPEANSQHTLNHHIARTPNLNPAIVKQIAEGLGLTFTPEKEDTSGTFAPIDLLDYIYAVLHSPSYREKYKEFLKIDFPRVPYPGDQQQFWQLVALGGQLRHIHLLESPVVEKRITTYPQPGSNTVEKLLFEITGEDTTGKVWINTSQYFDGVPRIAWEFYIGGYQPAQKWLKDRKGRELTFEDIVHYQKIIVALTETDRIMKEIDEINFIG